MSSSQQPLPRPKEATYRVSGGSRCTGRGAKQVLHLCSDRVFAAYHRQLALAGKPASSNFFEKDTGTTLWCGRSLVQTSVPRKLLSYLSSRA
jgi:hypothetical protein